MKRGKVLMTVLVVLAVLFASCSNGMSKDDADGAASTKVVSVYLGVDVEGGAQRTIASDTDLTNMTYVYRATPQWTQDRPIHGGTGTDFIPIPNYTPGSTRSLGSFTAGMWLIEVQVKKGDDVIYSGQTTDAIYTTHKALVVTVTPATGTGTVAIVVKVPTTGNSESLKVSKNGAAAEAMTPGDVVNNLRTYSKTFNSLDSGAYTFSFLYYDQNGTQTEGGAQAVNVYSGQTSNITGILDAGTWHPSTITINSPGFSTFDVKIGEPPAAIPAPPAFLSVAPSTGLKFTASAISALGNPVTFEWFVKGSSVGTNATYTLNEAVSSMYDVTCVAKDATAKFAASKSYFVKVGYGVSIGAMTGDGEIELAGAETIFAEGDIVPLTVTPDTGNHLVSISVNGTPVHATLSNYYDVDTNKASFYMPAGTATITATFAADAP